jgi:phosphoglycolate phosphatase
MRLLIFDLDGTLIDSRQDIINSVNSTLRYFGRPGLPAEIITAYVGDGPSMLIHRAFDEAADQRLLREASEFFLADYSIHKLDNTRAFPGVAEILAAAEAPQNGMNRHLTVLSNKPVDLAESILDGLGLGEHFDSVYGGNSFPTQKPDPLGALTILKETGVPPELSLIIGDSRNDVLTGRKAGIWTCGVTYGFAPATLRRAEPDLLVHSTLELLSLFAQELPRRSRAYLKSRSRSCQSKIEVT